MAVAVVPCILQHTFRNVCVRLARTLQLWQPDEARPRGTSFTPYHLVLRLCILTNMNTVQLFLCRFKKTNKLYDGENSISLMKYRNASFLFLNNAGTPENHHKAEEHPTARTKPVPHYSSHVSWSRWGINQPHSQRRKKPDSTSHFASLSKQI